MKRTISSLSLSVALLFASGCSLFQATQQGIEVTWETPSEPVDGFIIRYGSSPSSLTKEVTISSADIREVNDPEYGPVYRYLIRDVESSKKLFVSIAAVKGQSISNFSDVLEAQSEEGKPRP
jgi:hypothetical protein